MINKIIIKTLPLVPKRIVYQFAKKYIAGPSLEDAVQVTRSLMDKGGYSTIDVLGEFVTTRERALKETEMASKVLDAININKLDTYLSVKPTSLGMGIDFDFAYENISSLVKKATELGIFIRLDMENSPFTSDTIRLYKKIRENNYDNIGLVIQAYMKRSIDDVISLKEYKPNYRLCKGIYVESELIAYKSPDEIRDNYKKLFHIMLDSGSYVGIATHDEELIQFALKEIDTRKLEKFQYEFQMLLGVREKRRNEILADDHHLRVYVPFGEDWYGYSTRRLKENPKMVSHIIKSVFGIGQ